jgi:hypothetical protein
VWGRAQETSENDDDLVDGWVRRFTDIRGDHDLAGRLMAGYASDPPLRTHYDSALSGGVTLKLPSGTAIM